MRMIKLGTLSQIVIIVDSYLSYCNGISELLSTIDTWLDGNGTINYLCWCQRHWKHCFHGIMHGCHIGLSSRTCPQSLKPINKFVWNDGNWSHSFYNILLYVYGHTKLQVVAFEPHIYINGCKVSHIDKKTTCYGWMDMHI
jgi:hypothetical protein